MRGYVYVGVSARSGSTTVLNACIAGPDRGPIHFVTHRVQAWVRVSAKVTRS